ncbi:MAG: YhgE/Pip domain-containing protein [Leucobacter sp.]
MSLDLPSLRSGRRVTWSRVLGLILVPLTVAGVLLWGLWNPQERLDSVTAAVVNLDEPVELDGQLVPLGRVLAGELIAGDAEQNFTWVLTDAPDAEAGLADGRYATVVTIPENFSAAATSLSDDPAAAERATIDIAESTDGRLIDAALSNIVTTTATNVLNQQLGEQFVGGVFVGMGELGRGIGEAAHGATQLADGTGQLATGTRELADGTTQLADGTAELAGGTHELAGGAGQLATGAQELAGGAGGLAGGASELAGGASQLATGADGLAQGLSLFVVGDGTPENPGVRGYASGVRTFVSGDGGSNPGLVNYLAGVDQYATGIGGGFSEVRAGITQGAADLTAYRDGIADGSIAPPAGVDPAGLVQVLDEVIAMTNSPEVQEQLGKLDELIVASNGIAEGARGYAAGAEGIASGAEQIAAGAEGLTAGATELAGGARGLSAGAGELAGGASHLADGTAQLAGGTSELAAGTSQLAAGTSGLASGASELAAGTEELADGTTELAEGTGSLADGLDEAATGIPNYTETEREHIASTALAPVEAQGGSDELFNASGVPLFAGIALWAGALASFLLLAPLWRRTRDAALGVGGITVRSAVPAVLIGGVQGALAGIILPIALGYGFAQGARFFVIALLAGIAFSLVVQGLSALAGGFGRFAAFALLVVAFATGIVSTAPAALAAIGDASPVGAALAGFQAVAAGGSGGGTVVALVLWGLGGFALTALAVARARRAR